MSSEQSFWQKKGFKSEEEFLEEFERLNRNVKELNRDKRLLSIMNENSERLRKHYEEEKELQYLYNDLLLKNCPNMIMLFDSELCFAIGSSNCSVFFGETPITDLKHQPFLNIFHQNIDKNWVQKIYQQNLEALNTGKSSKYDDKLYFSDDSYWYIQTAISPIIVEGGACRGTVLTINDVTSLVEMKERAEEAAESKSAFLANMSHEIRTPMNAVKGFAELLAMTNLDQVQQKYISNIMNSSDALLDIINDVLDFSRMDAKRIELVLAEYDIMNLVSEVCNINNIRAEEKGLVFLADIAPDLPKTLKGDDIRIKQVLTNLLSNGIKYTVKGYVKLRMYAKRTEQCFWLVCEIEDSGIGIKKEDIEDLFDAFSRVDIKKNRDVAGTGLGLAISKRLADAMKGSIEVESVYGKGSVFRFTIPQEVIDPSPSIKVRYENKKKLLLVGEPVKMENIAHLLQSMHIDHHLIAADGNLDIKDEYTHCLYDESVSEHNIETLKSICVHCLFAEERRMKDSAEIPEMKERVIFSPILPMDIKKFLEADNNDIEKKENINRNENRTSYSSLDVLVVDDNEINLMLCQEMLKTFDIDAQISDGGYDALSRCSKRKYDLIFLDHMMPEIDGIEVVQKLRAENGPNKDTPVIALTANVLNDVKNKYIEAGMNDYIPKPIEFDQLERVLKLWTPEGRL